MSLSFTLPPAHVYIWTVPSMQLGKVLLQPSLRLHHLYIGKQEPLQLKEVLLPVPFQGLPAIQWNVVVLCVSIAILAIVRTLSFVINQRTFSLSMQHSAVI